MFPHVVALDQAGQYLNLKRLGVEAASGHVCYNPSIAVSLVPIMP